MPKALKYIEPTDPRRTDFLAVGQTERENRARFIKLRKDYYAGKHHEPLEMGKDGVNDNVVLNMVEMTVDRILSFIFPKMPTFEIDENPHDETPEEEWLREAFQENGGLSFMHKLGLNGALAGHVYVRVVPSVDDPEREYPRLINLDPAQIVTFWRSDDVDEVVWHELRWTMEEFHDFPNEIVRRVEHVLDFVKQPDHTWKIIEHRRDGGEWEKIGETIWNDYMGPIIHWQHLPFANSFYGKGEADNLGLQDALNLVMSLFARIVRHHSTPKTVLTGVADADDVLPSGVDGLWLVENTDARPVNLQLDSELQASQSLANFLYDTYLAQKRVVILRGEVRDFQRVTNTGVRTVFIDMLAKANILHETYGRGLARAARVMTVINDSTNALLPIVKFTDPLPTNELEQVQVLEKLFAMGKVSIEEIASRMNYNVEERGEDEESEEETEVGVNTAAVDN